MIIKIKLNREEVNFESERGAGYYEADIDNSWTELN